MTFLRLPVCHSRPVLTRGLVAAALAGTWLVASGSVPVALAGRFGPPWQDVVTASQTTLYNQPDRSSSVVGPLSQGDVVVVTGETTGTDGSTWESTPDGYVPGGDVTEKVDTWVAQMTVPSVSVYAKPNLQEGIRRTAQKGDLLRVTGVVHGLDGDTSTWWATTEGYVGLHTIAAGTSTGASQWTMPPASDAPNGWWGEIASVANVRAAPATDAPVVGALQPGERVKVLAEEQGTAVGGNSTWYLIDGGRYAGASVHSSLVRKMAPPTPTTTAPSTGSSGTWIVVDRATSALTLVTNGQATFTTYVSLGLAGVETPDGTYSTSGKYVADEMTSASVPNPEHSYDLPNVPFTQYYKDGGYAIHGTYWHDAFGTNQSQGCINVTVTDGAYLFGVTNPTVPNGSLVQWTTTDQATPVLIVN